MRYFFILTLTILFALNIAFAQDAASIPRLTNKQILKMVEAGVSSEVIISKIEVSRCNFDTDPTLLAELKQKGVSNEVLKAMIEAPYGFPKQQVIERSSVTVSSGLKKEEIPRETPSYKDVTIPAGTPVEIETLNGISSKEVNEGDTLNFLVVSPVKVSGFTVIDRGARARGIVSKASGGSSFGRAGELLWKMQDVIAVDGSRIPLQLSQQTNGESKKGTVAKNMIITGALVPPAAIFWGFKKGKAATIPAGRQLDVSVATATTVKGVSSLATPTSAQAIASLPAPVRNNDDGMPEYGEISEIRRMHRVYIMADDIDSQNMIARSLRNYEGVSIVGSPEAAEFFIAFRQRAEDTRITPRGIFAGTIDKNRKAQFIVFYRAESGRQRIVWQETEDTQTSSGITFSRPNEVNVIRHFIKALKDVRGS